MGIKEHLAVNVMGWVDGGNVWLDSKGIALHKHQWNPPENIEQGLRCAFSNPYVSLLLESKDCKFKCVYSGIGFNVTVGNQSTKEIAIVTAVALATDWKE